MTTLAKDRKMALLCLSRDLQDLHDTAMDPSMDEPERIDAARRLAMAMNRHFDLIMTGLRMAGGARRP